MNSELTILSKIPNIKDKCVLELGCCIGSKTKIIAKLCKEVVALEGRETNLKVCFKLKLPNVYYYLFNVEKLTFDSFGKFDIIFHSGVLYHLTNPVEHLKNIFKISNCIILDTHYTTAKKQEIRPEENQKSRAGLSTYSVFLPKKQIFKLFKDYKIHVFSEGYHFHKSRIKFIATK